MKEPEGYGIKGKKDARKDKRTSENKAAGTGEEFVPTGVRC